MALNQADRIAISKKIVSIPFENKAVEDTKGQLQVLKDDSIQKDNVNKTLFDDVNVFVNGYQSEFSLIDGNNRTEITEQLFLDAANKELKNVFFPNDAQTPTPSLPTGGWVHLPPFSRGYCVGKNYVEVYDTFDGEDQIFDGEDQILADINVLIGQMEDYNAAQRSTGATCSSGGTCSDPMYTDELSCTGADETWTANPTVDLDPDPVIHQLKDDIVARVNEWKTTLNSMSAAIPTDPDAGRQSQNDTATADITNAIPIIDTWLGYPDFDPNLPSVSDCAAFAALTADDFDPSKFRYYELDPLKAEITARLAFTVTRKTQLNTNLGSITQDMGSGEITASDGFYGQRYKIINLRLNLMAGSLNKVIGADAGLNAQDQALAINGDTEDVYSNKMTVSIFTAPAAGTKVVHVADGSGFSVGDQAYVAAATQNEIAATIEAVDGNMVTLSVNIPKKYRQDDLARLYKEN